MRRRVVFRFVKIPFICLAENGDAAIEEPIQTNVGEVHVIEPRGSCDGEVVLRPCSAIAVIPAGHLDVTVIMIVGERSAYSEVAEQRIIVACEEYRKIGFCVDVRSFSHQDIRHTGWKIVGDIKYRSRGKNRDYDGFNGAIAGRSNYRKDGNEKNYLTHTYSFI